MDQAFALASTDGILQDWVDEHFTILDGETKYPGVIYIEILPNLKCAIMILRVKSAGITIRKVYPSKSKRAHQCAPQLSSRKELIEMGEHIYAIEGCWYCHTDQTRTLVQDLVLNGSDSYPAPPSSPNEYIYQRITFPGTKRNGPDISRVGIKHPSHDWHMAHFWSPKSQSIGSIMPSLKHFFDFDPRR